MAHGRMPGSSARSAPGQVRVLAAVEALDHRQDDQAAARAAGGVVEPRQLVGHDGEAHRQAPGHRRLVLAVDRQRVLARDGQQALVTTAASVRPDSLASAISATVLPSSGCSPKFGRRGSPGSGARRCACPPAAAARDRWCPCRIASGRPATGSSADRCPASGSSRTTPAGARNGVGLVGPDLVEERQPRRRLGRAGVERERQRVVGEQPRGQRAQARLAGGPARQVDGPVAADDQFAGRVAAGLAEPAGGLAGPGHADQAGQRLRGVGDVVARSPCGRPAWALSAPGRRRPPPCATRRPPRGAAGRTAP